MPASLRPERNPNWETNAAQQEQSSRWDFAQGVQAPSSSTRDAVERMVEFFERSDEELEREVLGLLDWRGWHLSSNEVGEVGRGFVEISKVGSSK